MGPAIIAAVKPSSLYMTDLKQITQSQAMIPPSSTSSRARESERAASKTHAGTAGVMMDFSEALEECVSALAVEVSLKSLLLDMILREVILPS